jgi:hypothetical protein
MGTRHDHNGSEGTGKSLEGQSGRNGKVVVTARELSGKVEGVVSLGRQVP